MSTLSVTAITGVTSLSGGGFELIGQVANNASNTANDSATTAGQALTAATGAFGAANTSNIRAVAAFGQANSAFNAANTATPAGTIINYANTTAPSGYLRCDGNVYTRSSYWALANVIGTPPMLSSMTAEYSNSATGWSATSYIIAYANGVAFVSNTNALDIVTQFSGGLYTSTDGSTWTARTSSPFSSTLTSDAVRNGAIAANTANAGNSTWAILRAANRQTATTAQNTLMTSTDLVTWVNRTVTIAVTVTGGYNMLSINGLAGGGTENRLVLLFTHERNACCSYWQYRANTVSSNDGVNWTFTNSLFPLSTNNSVYYPSIAATHGTNGGFVVTHGNTAFFSSNGMNWTDISANLRTALGVSASANIANSSYFYNVFAANNQFIIPTKGNQFLVSSSANGANGNWYTVKPDTTLIASTPAYEDDHYWSSIWGTANIKLIHNGDVFVAYINNPSGYLKLIYSKNLIHWFSDNDVNYDVGLSMYYQIAPALAATSYARHRIAALPSGKILMTMPWARTIVSFTSTGYTSAIDFPVPKLSNQLQYGPIQYGGAAVPSIPYIKT